MIDEKKLIEDILWKVREQNVISEEAGHNRPFCDKANVIECINNQPQIGEWISCSERLPEIEGAYITTRNVRDIWTNEYLRKDIKIVTFLNRKWIQKPQYEVIAWQPLPSPYEVKSDE